MLVPLATEPEDTTRKLLQQVHSTAIMSDTKALADYRKRKLVTTTKIIHYSVKKGPKYAKEIPVEVTDLTPEMLDTGSWKTANFKPYNFKALGAPQNAGALHPLNKVREEFRKIFFHQGFIEMPTSRLDFCALRICCHVLTILDTSTLASGISTHSSFHNSTRPAISRIPFTSLIPPKPMHLVPIRLRTAQWKQWKQTPNSLKVPQPRNPPNPLIIQNTTTTSAKSTKEVPLAA